MLTPLSFIFRALVFLRSRLYTLGVLRSSSSGVPVIVIGNISVGGTGKTPMVSAIVRKLQQAGFQPGIVSRGYGAEPAAEPRPITASTPIAQSGDEPALLARETGVPVCVCGNRAAAVQYLVTQYDVNIVVSDDGLQHYAMQRDVELAVVDGQRLLGNGWLLPAGPLREPPNRLRSVDVIAVQQTPEDHIPGRETVLEALQLNAENGFALGYFHLDVVSLIRLSDDKSVALSTFSGSCVHALAGVGNPERFFKSLARVDITTIEHAMPDHHNYQPSDLQFAEPLPILITTKDAVKIRELEIDLANIYEVSVEAVFDEQLEQHIDSVVNTFR